MWALFVNASCSLLHSCTGDCRSLDAAFSLRVSGSALARQLLIASRLNLFKTPFRVWVPVGPGLVFKNTGCGDWCTISSPIVPQPPQRSPLSLLPEPSRARVTGVYSTHREEVGKLPTVSSAVASSLRTRDPRHAAGRRLVLRLRKVRP